MQTSRRLEKVTMKKLKQVTNFEESGLALLVRAIAIKHGMTAAGTRRIIQDVFEEISKAAWREGTLALPGLGTFASYDVKERKSSIVPGGVVLAHKVRKFRVSPRWRKR
jgi:nucleoid DNA-binding protein